MFIVNVEGAVFNNNKWLVVKRSTKEEHAGGIRTHQDGRKKVYTAENLRRIQMVN